MRHLSLSLLLLAAACGGSGDPATPGAAHHAEIKPTDFALVPCAGYEAARPCAIVRAGGKRVLIGAPGGIGQSLPASELAALDSVLLFSLHAEDIEGLDEIRNRSLRGGRETPLPVSGPQGTRQMVDALNKTFAIADARHLANAPKSAANSALLQAVAGERETKAEVFNTGDLIITHVQNADGWVGYWVDYEGQRAIIEPCGMSQATQFGGEAAASVACEAVGDTAQAWPLASTVRIARDADTPKKKIDAVS